MGPPLQVPPIADANEQDFIFHWSKPFNTSINWPWIFTDGNDSSETITILNLKLSPKLLPSPHPWPAPIKIKDQSRSSCFGVPVVNARKFYLFPVMTSVIFYTWEERGRRKETQSVFYRYVLPWDCIYGCGTDFMGELSLLWELGGQFWEWAQERAGFQSVIHHHVQRGAPAF